MKTKEKILHTSLLLFNRQGVEKVTTRHIANEMGISQGNLHYHYPNKDEIITTLFGLFIDEVKHAAQRNPELPFLKEEVLLSMKLHFEIMYRYRFLFTQNEVVWRRIPALQTQMIALLDAKKAEIKALIIVYRNEGVFRKEISEIQIDYLCDQFIFSISSWLNASPYMHVDTNHSEYFVGFTFRLWLPYLTPKEMKKWESLL